MTGVRSRAAALAPDPIPLRPHHLLCLQNFRGKGYSPAFIKKMTEVCAKLHIPPFSADIEPVRASGTAAGPAMEPIADPAVGPAMEPIADPAVGHAMESIAVIAVGRAEDPASDVPPASAIAPASVRLVSGADVLCESCPHCIDGRCDSEKPGQFDALVLKRTGLSCGALLLPAAGLAADARLEGTSRDAMFFLSAGMDAPGIPAMSAELLESCCPGCQWLPVCREACTEQDGRNIRWDESRFGVLPFFSKTL